MKRSKVLFGMDGGYEKLSEYQWIKQVPGVKIMCDFGDCEKGAMVQCGKCHDHICLDHMDLHQQSCGMSTPSKFEYEKDLEAMKN